MEINYKNLSDEELAKFIREGTEEVNRRKKNEEKRRWGEICDILHKWFIDFGDIDINRGEVFLDENCDFSCPGVFSTF